MPQLPVISPGQTKMTTASPNRRLDPSAESQPGRDVAMMGKAVAQMGFRMQEVQNLQQRTKASSNTTAKRNKILSDQNNDPDFSDERKAYYNSELKKAAPGEAQGIVHSGTRALFLANQEGATAAASLKIENNMRTKMFTDLEVRTQQVIYDEKVAAATATTQAEKTTAELNVLDLIEMLHKTGAITPQEYLKQKLNLKDDFKQFEFQMDLRMPKEATPIEKADRIKAVRRKARENAYLMTPKEQFEAEAAIDLTEKRVKAENKLEEKAVITQNTTDFAYKVATGEYSWFEAVESTNTTVVDPKVSQPLLNYLLSPDSIEIDADDSKYNEAVEDMAEKGFDTLAQYKFIATQLGNTKMTGENGAKLIKTVEMISKDATDLKNKGDGAGKWFGSMVQAVKKYSFNYFKDSQRQEFAYRCYNSIVDGFIDGKITNENYGEKVQKIIEGQVKDTFPILFSLDDVPNSIASKGKFQAVSPESKLKPDRVYKNEDKTLYTEDNLVFTAKRHNISVEELKKKLGIKDAN